MFVSLILAVGASLMPPLLAGLAVNDVKDGNLNGLTIVVIAFVAAAVVNWGAAWMETYLVNWVGQRALQDLRIQIFSHLQRLSIGFYSRNRAGVLISRLTNDVEALDQLVTAGIYTIFSAGVAPTPPPPRPGRRQLELSLAPVAVFPTPSRPPPPAG